MSGHIWRSPLGWPIPEGTAHALAADPDGDPSCICGFKPVPPEVKTQLEAAAKISRHVREVKS
jgi:hypothetical protein